MGITDEVLARRDRDAFDGGFEAGKEYAADAIASNERLTDLVRHQRHELYDAKLISGTEFVALAADSDGGKRVDRLESYGEVRKQLAAKDAAIAALKGAVQADVREFTRDSATLEAQAEQIRKTDIIVGDMSMLIRMMVTKHRRGKLDEEYCQKALDYLQRKGLQGNILRALASTAPVAEKKEELGWRAGTVTG